MAEENDKKAPPVKPRDKVVPEQLEARLLGIDLSSVEAEQPEDGVTLSEERAEDKSTEPDDRVSDLELRLLDLNVNDFAHALSEAPKEIKPKASRRPKETKSPEARNSNRGPSPLAVGGIFLVVLGLTFFTVHTNPNLVPQNVRTQIEKTTAAIVKSLPSVATQTVKPSNRGLIISPHTKRTPANHNFPAPQQQAAPTPTEPEEELAPEERLAKTDPAWRRRWETYKRLFILANQMKQQPPVRPQMPTTESTPEPQHPHVDDAGDPNPFGFPEE